jgi:Major Facilitator Superfamily
VPSYVELLRPAGIFRLFIGSLIGRTSFGMIPVGVVLFIGQEKGSFYLAGLATSAYALATVVAGPARSWVSVRIGHGASLLLLSIISGVSLLLLVPFGQGDGATSVLIVLAGISGFSVPPFGGLMRVGWSRKLPDKWVPRAFGLDSVVEESAFVVGPLLATGAVAISGPWLAVLASGATCMLGGLVMSSAAEKGSLAASRGRGSGGSGLFVAVRQLGWVLAVFAGVGFTIGAIEVAIPGFATGKGYPTLAGGLFAVLALGSAFAALLYGRRHWNSSPSSRLLILGFLLSAAAALTATADDTLLAIPLFLLIGLFMGPAVMTAYLLADTLLEGAAVKTHGAILASVSCNGGAGMGAALAGATIADLGVWQAFLLSGVMTAVLTAVGFLLYLYDKGRTPEGKRQVRYTNRFRRDG